MPLRNLVLALCQLAAVGAIAALTIGFFGKHFWLFDLFAHFRLQYAVVLSLCGLLCLLLNSFKLGAVNLAAALLVGLTFLPFTVSKAALNSPGLKVISYNVHTANTRHEEVIEFLRSENADVVFLMETNANWVGQLSALSDLYPNRLANPREDNFGILLLSKLPFVKSEILYFGEHSLPAADVTVRKDSHSYRILGIHVLPPTSRANSENRDHHLLQAADRIASSVTPHRLLVGDFNLTTYSPWFHDVLHRSKMQNVSPGYAPTWMTGNPFFAIPIDHVLTSPSLKVGSRRIGPALGSDHNALIVEVAPELK